MSAVSLTRCVTLSAVACALSSALLLQGPRLVPHPVFPRFEVSEICLGCICEATTNCNLTIGCWRGRCGPFLISKEYWIEAGRPTLPGDNPNYIRSYLGCVNHPVCAATTVKQYIARYAQDCNRDGFLSCDDYARLHYLGGKQCGLPIEHYGFYKVFSFCSEGVSWLNG